MSRLGKIFSVMAALSLISFVIVRFLLGTWVPFLWLALGCFAFFFIAASVVDRKFYVEFLTMKTTKQGMSMGAMIGLVLVLLAAVNFISARHYKTFDFSMLKVNTLSDQSVKLLKSLKSPLKILYFYKNGTEGIELNRRAFIELMKKYQDQSPQVQLDFVEMNERPDLVQQYDIKQGTQLVFIEYNGKKTRIEKIDEQELTSAIAKVTRDTDKTVYILTGHAEPSLEESSDGNSISFLKTLLEESRYVVKPLNLSQVGSIPNDCDVLIVAGPKQALLDAEVKAIEEYFRNGGSAIFAFESRFDVGLNPLLQTLRIKVQQNYIATTMETPVGRAVDPRATVGSIFSAESPITKPFSKNEFMVFRLPSSLESIRGSELIRTDELVKTGVNVMAFKDLQFKNEGQKGPFVLGMTSDGKYPGASSDKNFSAVVFGDADFLTNQFVYKNLNRDLILNSVSYLAHDENLISISPKEIQRSELVITDTQMAIFILGFIIPLPVIFFVFGGVFWYRRRNA
jgi:ABC-type uncharacterized transport system involved in gliding motility auxiliary subunit